MLHKKKSPFLIKKRTFPIQHHLHPYEAVQKVSKSLLHHYTLPKFFVIPPITPTTPTYNFS